ncbi:alpha/beta fold hydrolase [Streptomyces sp. NPDC054887]
MPTPTDERTRGTRRGGASGDVRAAVRVHHWEGFRFESRLVRAPERRLPPVLLIGGAFQRKERWGYVEQEILRYSDVLTVDPPGWGSADLLPEQHGVEIIADCLHHMLGELGLSRLNIAAGSYGTAIAYRLAQAHPEDVGRMLLFGTMCRIPDHARTAIRHTLDLLDAQEMDLFARATVDLFMSRKPGAGVVNGRALRRILHTRFATAGADETAKYRANTRRLLRHTMLDTTSPPPHPVLVVTGEHDTFTTPELCREMAACCADSQYAEVADADHMVHLERAHEMGELAERFYSGLSIAGLPYLRTVRRVRGEGAADRDGRGTPERP